MHIKFGETAEKNLTRNKPITVCVCGSVSVCLCEGRGGGGGGTEGERERKRESERELNVQPVMPLNSSCKDFGFICPFVGIDLPIEKRQLQLLGTCSRTYAWP